MLSTKNAFREKAKLYLIAKIQHKTNATRYTTTFAICAP